MKSANDWSNEIANKDINLCLCAGCISKISISPYYLVTKEDIRAIQEDAIRAAIDVLLKDNCGYSECPDCKRTSIHTINTLFP